MFSVSLLCSLSLSSLSHSLTKSSCPSSLFMPNAIIFSTSLSLSLSLSLPSAILFSLLSPLYPFCNPPLFTFGSIPPQIILSFLHPLSFLPHLFGRPSPPPSPQSLISCSLTPHPSIFLSFLQTYFPSLFASFTSHSLFSPFVSLVYASFHPSSH